MPGIAGILSKRADQELQHTVISMISVMEYQPFYDSGVYFFPELGIYAGWVAREDSFADRQPFVNHSKDVVLLFSGECFMDNAMRSKLTRQGYEPDQGGEWLAHFYEQEGDRFFEKLNGSFSGLLIDKRKNKAFVFNDRYGVERIYWHETDSAVYFASEAKALLQALPQLRVFDQEGVAQLISFGCTLGGRTLFRGIHLLPPSSLWSFENGRLQKTNYFRPVTWESQPTLSEEEFQRRFEETFKRILPRYLESNCRAGISLTAGVDSRIIMACVPPGRHDLICYTFSGKDRDTLDARLANRVAKACGLEHRILRLGPQFFADFGSYVDCAVQATDGYLGTLGAHEIYLNSLARALSPIRLTGVFGGEILRGVSMFKPLHFARQLVNASLAETMSSCLAGWSQHSQHPVSFTVFSEIPQKRFATPAASRSQTAFRTPYLDNEVVALAYQAPPAVRTSVSFGLSLATRNNPVLGRIPTDMGGMGNASPIAAGWRRIFSKLICKVDYLRTEGLPANLSRLDTFSTRLSSMFGIAGLHKYISYRTWFQRELAEYVGSRLTDSTVRGNPLWNTDFLERMASDHIAGRKNYLREIDLVLTIEAVERLLFRQRPRQSIPHQDWRSKTSEITAACRMGESN